MPQHLTPKDGAGIAPAPVPTSAGSHSASDPVRAKIRALHDAIGPCFLRLDDGRTCVLSAHALQIVDIPPVHEAPNA